MSTHALNTDTQARIDKKREWLDTQVAACESRSEEAARNTPRQLFLPGFDVGAFPNHLNRSSLIAPIARGPRKFHRQAEMITRTDCVLKYTGEQLDETDGDLLMVLIAIAQPYPFGASVPITPAKLLQKINHSTGNHDYEWLHRRIKAMTEATLFLEAKKKDGSTRYSVGKTVSFRIIAGFVYDDVAKTYSYSLDPRWVEMFSNREYSLVDWDKRMQIRRGQYMAKTLQRLVATSDNHVQRYALDWLKSKMAYTSPVRKFRESLAAACGELERLDVITSHKIQESTRGKEQLVMWMEPSG